MNIIINIGPLALNGSLLAFVVAWFTCLTLIKIYCQKKKVEFEPIRKLLEGMVVSGIVGARLFFVAQFHDSFINKPWEVLFFWQGGFTLMGGVAGALIFALWVLVIKPAKNKKQLVVIGSTALLLTSIGFWTSLTALSYFYPQPEPPALLNFELTDMSDNPVQFDDLAGKPMVLNFWATWCPPCRREMPLLESSYADYQQQGIAIVAINVGEDGNTIQNYLEANALTLPVWKDGVHATNTVFGYFGGKVMPTTLFIDKQGVVIRTRTGELSAATLRQGIEEILPSP
jgi:thiol-disulfide isomerase/thioredoxin